MMITRRSKRLSKTPASGESNSQASLEGKKQKLDLHSTEVNTVHVNGHTKDHDRTLSSPNLIAVKKKKRSAQGADSDSSDSSDDYMQSPQTLDLDSDFFKVNLKKGEPSTDFSSIENKIFSGVQRLSDVEESSGSDEDCKMFQKEYIASMNSLVEQVQSVGIVRKDLSNKFRKKSSKKKQESQLKLQKVKAEKGNTDLENMDVSKLLALGENKSEIKPEKTSQKHITESENEMTDWEEVGEGEEDKERVVKPENYSFPKEGVQITVDAPDMYQKRKKKGFDMEEFMKRRMNRVKRELQVLIHKVHLLCWIAHGIHVNSVLSSDDLMGLALSLIPSQDSYPKSVNVNYLKQVSVWFAKTVTVREVPSDKKFISLHDQLHKQFEAGAANSKRDLVLMFVCLLRSLGINARLVISLQPLPLKPPTSELLSVANKKTPEAPTTKAQKKQNQSSSNLKTDGKEQTGAKGLKPKFRMLSAEEAKQNRKRNVMSKEEALKRLKTEDKGKNKESGSGKSEPRRSSRPRRETKSSYKEHSDSESEDKNEQSQTKDNRNKSGASSKSSLENNPTSNSLSSTHLMEKNNDRKNDETARKRSKLSRNKDSKRESEKDYKPSQAMSENSEDEFIPSSQRAPKLSSSSSTSRSKRNSKNNKTASSRKEEEDSGSEFDPELSSRIQKRIKSTDEKGDIDRRVLSSDSENESSRGRTNVWTEVFVEGEQRWVPVDVTLGDVDCAKYIYRNAMKPVAYVVAWNTDCTLKDVTRRYCSQYHSITRKLRVDEYWWKHALFPFRVSNTPSDRKEDLDMEKQLEDRPLPTSIAEYKDHPLYVLERHLLKFQAIYPPDAPTMGFIRGEAVYPRACVQTLRSREVWVKEAKVVRPGEKPYKIVKARPKYDRMSGKVVSDLPLEIFGRWQVEDYVPPTAVDGKVPRNPYGNVELFKACMLPKGTVHLQVPGLNRVAKKLQIDCAPAVVGFDFHCGASHPTYDGFVVCEEYQDVLMDAWNRDQEESERRQQEKRDKRVYGNWRRLIKGLIIREHLKLKYAFGEDDNDATEATGSKAKPRKKPKITARSGKS